MSDDKKPKKDLRARLGRTIAPNTPGAPAIAPPAAAPQGGAAAPRPASPSVTPPVVAPPVVAPPMSSPFGGPQVAPPPFAQPAQQPQRSEPPRSRPPADPFASGPSAQGPQEVRLVIDDKPVDDSEVGKRARGRGFLILGIGLALGALLGGGFVSVNSRNVLFNATVRDGHEIYDTVTASTQVVLGAQQKIDRLVERAAGTATQPSSVDYDTIRELQGLEIPIHAGAFARKNYGAFNPSTVDDLFAYYNNVQILWERFGQLAGRTLPDARRAELDRTAAMAADAATTEYGLIPQASEQGVLGILVVLDPANPATPTKRTIRPRPGSPQQRELELLTVETTITDSPSHVIPIDNRASAGVLSSQLGAFRDYVTEIRELKALMDQTIEIQGRLTTALGEIARLEEVFAI